MSSFTTLRELDKQEKGLVDKPCKYCGEVFTPKTPWQIYDKPKCRKAAFEFYRRRKNREADNILSQVRKGN